MRKILLIAILFSSANCFAQSWLPGYIKPLVGRDLKLYPDTVKSFNVTWPIYGVNDSTIAVKRDTIVSGAVSGANITIMSTTNATKGKILFGGSVYDEVNNRLGIGTTVPAFQIQIVDSGANSTRGISLVENNTSNFSSYLNYRKSRGTPNAPTAVTNSDNLGILDFAGYAGSTNTYQIGARINGIVNGTVSDVVGGIATDLVFSTSPNPTLTERMRIRATGLVGIGSSNPSSQLHILDEAAAASTRGLILGESNTSTLSSLFQFQKSRGTFSSPTAVVSGDVTGVIDFKGYVGSTNTYLTSARIQGNALGTVTDIANGLTSNLTFSTRNRVGFAERWRIDTTGNFTNSGTETSSAALQTTSFSTAYIAKTGTYTATAADNLINCTSGTFTVTLPTAVGISGREYWVTNPGSGTITIGTTSSQTFTNVTATPTTLTLAQFTNYRVVSDGANWLAFKIVN